MFGRRVKSSTGEKKCPAHRKGGFPRVFRRGGKTEDEHMEQRAVGS